MKKISIRLAIIAAVTLMSLNIVSAQTAPGINPEHMPDSGAGMLISKQVDTTHTVNRTQPVRKVTAFSKNAYDDNRLQCILCILKREALSTLLLRIATFSK